MNNLDLKGYKGFKLLKGDNSKEAQRLYAYCLTNDIPCIRVNLPYKSSTYGAYGCSMTGEIHKGLLMCIEAEREYIPCGSVEWCGLLLDKKVIPDYYPEWAKSILHRKVWQGDKWLLQKVFVKPADRYKRFTGFVTTGTYKGKKKPPFWFSEVVHFENEWRCYITNGIIKACEWYWGDEVNTPEISLEGDIIKTLQLFIPSEYSGALDIGYIKSVGELAVIESQHPFACGWYGRQQDDHIYFQWLIDGWDYMQNLINKKE